jgi:hypothetical protein
MKARHLAAVVANDARLHGRAVALTQAGAVALVWLATRWPRSEDAVAGLVLNLNIVIALLWGDWLVSREKLKATFGWLRTTPLADGDLVLAKFVSTIVCCSTMWVATTLPFLRGYYAARPAEWCVLWLAIVALAGLSMAIRWRFTQQLGLVAPLLIVLLPLLVLIAIKRDHPETVRAVYGLWDHTGGRAAIAASLVAVLVSSWQFTRWWVGRSDTFGLLE